MKSILLGVMLALTPTQAASDTSTGDYLLFSKDHDPETMEFVILNKRDFFIRCDLKSPIMANFGTIIKPHGVSPRLYVPKGIKITIRCAKEEDESI